MSSFVGAAQRRSRLALLARVVFVPFERLWALLVLIALWQAYVVAFDVNSIVMPRPADVLGSIITDWSRYAHELRTTLVVAVVGLLLGAAVGTVVAILAWISRVASGVVSMGVMIVRSTPLVVFVPILARALGYNVPMVIVVVTLISFFPSFVLVSSGLAGLPSAATDLSDVFGASKLRRLRYVALPAAMPKLFASIRLSSSRAVLGAMVTEFVTGVDGLGKLFLIARSELESELAIGAALIGGAAALVLFHVSEWLETWANQRMT